VSRTLLFIDDDPDIRDAIGDLLEYAGWSVAHASDGLEALAWLRANDPPAGILLDLKMPRCDGYEFRRRQVADPRLAAIPTIVLTADGQVYDPTHALASLSILQKPLDFDELLRLLPPIPALE
jgi:CheY-like chemotaxis protein